jgi:hypothetical protein
MVVGGDARRVYRLSGQVTPYLVIGTSIHDGDVFVVAGPLVPEAPAPLLLLLVPNLHTPLPLLNTLLLCKFLPSAEEIAVQGREEFLPTQTLPEGSVGLSAHMLCDQTLGVTFTPKFPFLPWH